MLINAGVKEIIFDEQSPLEEMAYALLLQAKMPPSHEKWFDDAITPLVAGILVKKCRRVEGGQCWQRASQEARHSR